MALDQRIVEAVEAIGQSEQKLAVFRAVYYHKRRVKSVSEIEEATGLERVQILKVGVSLRKSGLFDQVPTPDGVGYQQIEFYQHNKEKIIRFVNDPRKMEKFAGEPAPAVAASLSFVRPRPPSTKSTQRERSKAIPKVRIAFLTTNPLHEASLRTDMEVRDVQQMMRKSANRDLVDIRHLPAATVQDLLDALNEFRPHIVHFSGHGGAGALLFDSKEADKNSGVEIDFALVRDIVSATHTPPTLLVFNACDTLNGAEICLETVKAVVAMSSEVTDAAAIMFAGQFYAALASGQSIAVALKQGVVVLKAAKLPDADLPKLITSKGVSGTALKFV